MNGFLVKFNYNGLCSGRSWAIISMFIICTDSKRTLVLKEEYVADQLIFLDDRLSLRTRT